MSDEPEPLLCRSPPPARYPTLSPCCCVIGPDSVPWVSDGRHDGPHVWVKQEGRGVWVYEEDLLSEFPRLRLHADLTTADRMTLPEMASLVAYLDVVAASAKRKVDLCGGPRA